MPFPGLLSVFPVDNKSLNIELHHFADYRDYNLIFLAAEEGNNDFVKMLLKLGIPAELQMFNVNAQQLAWNKGHSDVLLTFVQSNLTYPSAEFDVNFCSNELKSFYQQTSEIHNAILNGDIESVSRIVKSNPGIYYFYNQNNESAAKSAVLNQQVDIYEFLLQNGIFFGPHENTEGIMGELTPDIQHTIRELHYKYSKEITARHINILMAHTFICHDVPNIKKKLILIQHAFSTLSDDASIEPILRIVAASQGYRIIFDFNRESVKFLDPTGNPDAQGLFYLSGRIYIGAKQLLDASTERETISNLIHELSHYAMQLTYENFAKPYKPNDEMARQEFEEISKECKENSENDFVVGSV